MVEKNDPRVEQAKEKFKKVKEELEQAIVAVQEIGTATPPLNEGEVVGRIKEAVSKLVEITQLAERARAQEEGFNSIQKQIELTELIEGLNLNRVPQEVKDYFLGYIIFSLLKKEGKFQGLLGQLFQISQKRMENAAQATTWADIKQDFTQVEQEAKALQADQGISHSIKDLEDKAEPLVKVVDSNTDVNWSLLSTEDPKKHTPIHAIDNFTDFRRQVRFAAGLVDGGQPLRSDLEQLLRDKIDRLNDDLLVFKTEPDVLQAARNLQALLEEIIARSNQNQGHREIEKDDTLKDFFRPKTEKILVNGEDEVQLFLEYIGLDEIEAAEKISLQIAKGGKKVALSPSDIAQLESLREKFNRLSSRYVNYVNNVVSINPTGATIDYWDISTRLSGQIGEYKRWLDNLIKLAGGRVKEDVAEAPELEQSQEIWLAFFTSLAERPNAYDELEKWARIIWKAFYPSSEAKESHLNSLNLRRYNAWRDAVSKKYKDTKEVRYKLLDLKFDNNRLILDAAITFAQLRGMTADWHSEEMLARLQKESQSLHGFKPEAIDFFIIPTDRYRKIKREALKKTITDKTRLDEEVEEIHNYPHAEEVNWAVDEMKILLLTPGSGFYRKEWSDDDASKNALTKLIADRLKTRFEQRGQTIGEDDIKDISEVAYTIACFSGMRLDTFAESYIAGDSPAGNVIPPRQEYFKDGCPATGYFYAAYEYPKFLPELEFTYNPKDLVTTWKVRYITMAQSPESAKDFRDRINSIEQAIHGSELALDEYAPLRTHDKRPFGYPLERYDYDGMLKWQYPSMYRFLFDPQFQAARVKGMTFFEWAEGFKAFKEYRKVAHADLNVEGKKPEEAKAFLIDQLNNLIAGVSKLKTNMLVDWNYIAVLMVAFIDRMFRAYSKVEGNAVEKETQRVALYNDVTQLFGAVPIRARVAAGIYSIVASPDAPEVILDMSNNKLNTAGEVDLFRTLPAWMDINEKKRLYETKINKMKKDARDAAAKLPDGPKKQEALAAANRIGETELKVPFARAVLEQLWQESTENAQRRHMKFHVAEDPQWIAFRQFYPNFERTVKPFGLSTEKQKETATGKKE